MTFAEDMALIARENQLANTPKFIEGVEQSIAEAADLGFFDVEITEPDFNIEGKIVKDYFINEGFKFSAYERDTKRYILIGWHLDN